MQKKLYVITVLAAVLSATSLYGQEKGSIDADLDLVTGYRIDNLDWSIAGNTLGQNPNILSELIWSNLQIYHLELGAEVYVYNFAIVASFGYGWIFQGANRDSDYLGNNRTQEFSRSNNQSDTGSVLDIEFGIGYRARIASDDLVIVLDLTPLVGFAIHEQALRMTEGFQTIPPLGSFAGLASTYQASWHSLWVKADAALNLGWFDLFGSFQFDWAFYYYGSADWNLRTDFQHPVSFEQESGGYGFTVSGGLGVTIIDMLELYASAYYLKWIAGAGVDRTFLAGGAVAVTRLNSVNWNSIGIMFGLTLAL